MITIVFILFYCTQDHLREKAVVITGKIPKNFIISQVLNFLVTLI